jgi:hypothetical protein
MEGRKKETLEEITERAQTTNMAFQKGLDFQVGRIRNPNKNPGNSKK